MWTAVTEELRRVLFVDKPAAAFAASPPARVAHDVMFTQRAVCQQPDRTFLVGRSGEKWCVAEEVAGDLARAELKPSERSAKELAQQWRDTDTELRWTRVTGEGDDLSPLAALGASRSSDWGKKNLQLRWQAQSRRDVAHRNYFVGEGNDGWYWGSKIGHALGAAHGPLSSANEAKRGAQQAERSTP